MKCPAAHRGGKSLVDPNNIDSVAAIALMKIEWKGSKRDKTFIYHPTRSWETVTQKCSERLFFIFKRVKTLTGLIFSIRRSWSDVACL